MQRLKDERDSAVRQTQQLQQELVSVFKFLLVFSNYLIITFSHPMCTDFLRVHLIDLHEQALNSLELFCIEKFSMDNRSLLHTQKDKKKEKIWLNQVVPRELIPWKIKKSKPHEGKCRLLGIFNKKEVQSNTPNCRINAIDKACDIN